MNDLTQTENGANVPGVSSTEDCSTQSVLVSFVDGYNTSKEYQYICPHKVAVGNHAVVDVQGTYKVVRVIEVIPYIGSQATKFVVDIVNDQDYKSAENARKERDTIVRRLKTLETKRK